MAKESGAAALATWVLLIIVFITWGSVMIAQEKPLIAASEGTETGVANVTAVGQYTSRGYYYSYSQWFTLTYKLGACTWTQTVPVGPFTADQNRVGTPLQIYSTDLSNCNAPAVAYQVTGYSGLVLGLFITGWVLFGLLVIFLTIGLSSEGCCKGCCKPRRQERSTITVTSRTSYTAPPPDPTEALAARLRQINEEAQSDSASYADRKLKEGPRPVTTDELLRAAGIPPKNWCPDPFNHPDKCGRGCTRLDPNDKTPNGPPAPPPTSASSASSILALSGPEQLARFKATADANLRRYYASMDALKESS